MNKRKHRLQVIHCLQRWVLACFFLAHQINTQAQISQDRFTCGGAAHTIRNEHQQPKQTAKTSVPKLGTNNGKEGQLTGAQAINKPTLCNASRPVRATKTLVDSSGLRSFNRMEIITRQAYSSSSKSKLQLCLVIHLAQPGADVV